MKKDTTANSDWLDADRLNVARLSESNSIADDDSESRPTLLFVFRNVVAKDRQFAGIPILPGFPIEAVILTCDSFQGGNDFWIIELAFNGFLAIPKIKLVG